MSIHSTLWDKCINRTHLNLSADCWDLRCPMRMIDEFAGSVVGGEANNMLEGDVVHEVLFIEALLNLRLFRSYRGK